MDYTGIIAMQPGKRSGKPCIRGLRITVYDVLGYLAAGMTREEILSGFAVSDDAPWDCATALASRR